MQVPEEYRVKTGAMASSFHDGNNGHFMIPLMTKGKQRIKRVFSIIASDGLEWDHVSVSLPDRCPTWEEMCYFKKLFWGANVQVIQFHPPESEYINNHPYCLHLWKPQKSTIAFPHKLLVGI